jgi:hypothetical protein
LQLAQEALATEYGQGIGTRQNQHGWKMVDAAWLRVKDSPLLYSVAPAVAEMADSAIRCCRIAHESVL